MLCCGRRNIILLLPSGEFPEKKSSVSSVVDVRLHGSTKYQPYEALHQQFSRQYLKQYDTDDTGTLFHIELTSMLDSLRSTLSSETVNSFTPNGKKAVEDELTVGEAIRCLEMQVGRPPNEKKRVVSVEEGASLLDLSTPGTPGGSGVGMGMGMSRSLSIQTPPQLGKLDFSGPPMHLLQDLEVSSDDGALKVHRRHSLRTQPSSVSNLSRRLLPVSAVVSKKHSHRHTPPANPQVPPQMLKTPPAPALGQTRAQAPKIPSSA